MQQEGAQAASTLPGLPANNNSGVKPAVLPSDLNGNKRAIKVLYLYTDRDIFDFVMYYIYGQSGPSLLIESTDSMMHCV